MVFVSAWSVANMLHGLAHARAVRVLRFLLGAAEPANFPAGVKAVSEWFPMRERALAIGIFNAGTALGRPWPCRSCRSSRCVRLALGLRGDGRAGVRVGRGLGGVLSSSRRAPAPGGEASAPSILETSSAAPLATRHAPVSMGRLLRIRETWGCIARPRADRSHLLLPELLDPEYLQEERGFSLADIGAYGWIPFAALALGNVASGAIPRALIARAGPRPRTQDDHAGVVVAMPLFSGAAVDARRWRWSL